MGGTTARLLSLALAVAGLAVLPGPGAPTATAAGAASQPIAIGVSSKGTSYVGFASGGALARINADGKRLSPLVLDQRGPVTAISVAPDDRVWVYYGTSVSAFDPGGRLHRHFEVSAPGTCDASTHDPRRYGGLVVTATTVYVASRCDNTLEAWSKYGARRARVSLPKGGFPRGIAWMRAQRKPRLPARLFVAMPDQGQLLTYNADRLRSGSRPTARHQVERPTRGSRPAPSGITADRYGVVAITDAANHGVYIYDANAGMSPFRTLGHPPRAAKFAGALDSPTAMAQHAQDGGGLSGNLFIADTGNSRAQRWDIGGGYTYWASRVSAPRPNRPGDPGDPDGPDGPVDPDGPDDDGAPVNTARPTVVGEARTGRTLSCAVGTWQGAPSGFGFRWLRDGTPVPGATASTYVVAVGDQGTELTCRVTASNASGSTSSTSEPVFVGDPVAPVNLTPPVISGVAWVGRTLTCSSGTWAGAPSYSYVWLRGGVLVGTAPTYVAASSDAGRSLTCTVIATTAAGSLSATSAPVTIT